MSCSGETAVSARLPSWMAIRRSGTGREFYPFASIGLPPQDLKYQGEPTTLEIGAPQHLSRVRDDSSRNRRRRRVTTIGDHNLFMAYVHVAHDCHVGSETIFGPGATLGGHVTVDDFATISAYSGVHQFCRVGRHAFIGGYSVVTKDALPFAKTVGARGLCRVYGLNTIGLVRRGFRKDTLTKLEARLSLSAAVQAQRHAGVAARSRATAASRAPEVEYLVDVHPHRLAWRHPQARQADGRRGVGRLKTSMKLGLIAGNGRFPFLVLDAARAMGHEVTIVAMSEEALQELEDAAAHARAAIHWISLGHLGACLKVLNEAGVSHAVMAGQVKHTKIFEVLPDMTMSDRADTASGAQHRRVDRGGRRGHAAARYSAARFDRTAQAIARQGRTLSRSALDDDQRKDLAFGYRMADAIAGLDIGQTIVVKHQAVVAVEAMEGTDETIARAGALAGPGAVVVKVAKPETGHAIRCPNRGAGDDSGHAGSRRGGLVGRCRQNADLRWGRVLAVG